MSVAMGYGISGIFRIKIVWKGIKPIKFSTCLKTYGCFHFCNEDVSLLQGALKKIADQPCYNVRSHTFAKVHKNFRDGMWYYEVWKGSHIRVNNFAYRVLFLFNASYCMFSVAMGYIEDFPNKDSLEGIKPLNFSTSLKAYSVFFSAIKMSPSYKVH